MKKICLIMFILFNAATTFSQNDEIKSYIRKESIGGKLDFTKVVEEYKSYLIAYEKVMYNKKDFAILLWGAKVKELGVKSLNETIDLWEDINQRKLTAPELKALKVGFESNR
jgi:hypothetical protein